ncbi:MAG TPA: hypothetical protein PLZ84_02935 [Clostridia bacterium]|nr:hypothetical protein [Clostridia bacterium]
MKSKRAVFLFAVIGIALLAAAAWRAFYGFDWSDESYYAALTSRIYAGDVPFVQVWDIHQTSALLLAPLYSLYRAVNEACGAILFFRFVFIAFQLFLAVFSFTVFRRKVNLTCALIISLVIFIFAPYALPTMSYNTMLVGFMAFCALCLYRVDDKAYRFPLTAAGAFYMLAVISYPVLIIALPGFVPVLILKARKHNLFA